MVPEAAPTKIEAGVFAPLSISQLVVMTLLLLTGWIAAGRPVIVKLVELLVPVVCTLGVFKLRITRPPTRTQRHAMVGEVVIPVKVPLNVPVSGVMSTSVAAFGPNP
jgi:hypothetical protein